jgi:hypothetical protein
VLRYAVRSYSTRCPLKGRGEAVQRIVALGWTRSVGNLFRQPIAIEDLFERVRASGGKRRSRLGLTAQPEPLRGVASRLAVEFRE